MDKRPKTFGEYWTFGLFAGLAIAFQIFLFWFLTYVVLEIASSLISYDSWPKWERDDEMILWGTWSLVISGPLAVGLAVNRIVGECLASEQAKAATEVWIAAGCPAVNPRSEGGPTWTPK